MITALIRVEGRPLGLIANNPAHLAGAIDSHGADKAARFMQLCDAFDIPLLFLCDTPGIMVGPESEKTALVRHAAPHVRRPARASRVPIFTIILRKAFGLARRRWPAATTRRRLFTVSWPTGEFGGMGLEGRLSSRCRDEPAASEDPATRKALYDELVERRRQNGKAAQLSGALRTRRRDRSGRIAPLDLCRTRQRPPAPPRRTARSGPASTPGEGFWPARPGSEDPLEL